MASQEDMAAQKAAGRWLEGLLSGDEVVTHEVFSYSGDVYLDRQVLTIFLTLCSPVCLPDLLSLRVCPTKQ